MAGNFKVNTDAGTLLLVAGVGLGLYLWFNRQSLAAAAGDAAAAGAQFAAGGVYGAAGAIENALFPQQRVRPGQLNPQGYIPQPGDPYYGQWLAQAAGSPGLIQNIAPGATTPTGRVFEQFTPLYSPSPSPLSTGQGRNAVIR